MALNTRIAVLKFAAAALLIVPGAIMIAALISPLMSWVEAFLDLAHQPLDRGQQVEGDAARLLNAILGGVLIGFGVMIWLVADRVYRQDEGLGRSLIVIPLISWFVFDGAGSVLAGAWFNLVLNTGFLIMFLAPLFWPASKKAQA